MLGYWFNIHPEYVMAPPPPPVYYERLGPDHQRWYVAHPQYKLNWAFRRTYGVRIPELFRQSSDIWDRISHCQIKLDNWISHTYPSWNYRNKEDS